MIRATAFRRFIASVALVSIGLVCVMVLHLVPARHDLSPIGARLSEYALGRCAPLMLAAFAASGVGIVGLAWALRRGRQWSHAVPALLASAGVGMVLSGIFPTDRLRSGATADAVHSSASALATVALIASALTWSVWRPPRHRLDTTLAVLGAGLGAASPALHRSSITGLSQRLLWLTLLVWLIVTACRLTASPRIRHHRRQRRRQPHDEDVARELQEVHAPQVGGAVRSPHNAASTISWCWRSPLVSTVVTASSANG